MGCNCGSLKRSHTAGITGLCYDQKSHKTSLRRLRAAATLDAVCRINTDSHGRYLSESLSLPLGESRTIDYLAGDAPELKRRLYALGFVPGARITKLRVAPFGDPIQVRVGGSSVSMRRREASMIHLQSSPHSHD